MLALALGAGALAPAAASAAPATGDWEARGAGGALGSFELARTGGRLVVEDLVVQAPINCANAFGTPPPVDVEVIGRSTRLEPDGGFASGAIRRGNGTAIRAAYRGGRFSLSYRHVASTANAYAGGEQVCGTGTIRLTARRSQRRALTNGVFEGSSVQQEAVELSVVAGGRALMAPAAPGPGGVTEYPFQLAAGNPDDSCAYQLPGPLFIAPNGSFSNAALQLGDEASVSGRFTGTRTVSGSFSNPGQSCSAEGWSARWAFTPR